MRKQQILVSEYLQHIHFRSQMGQLIPKTKILLKLLK